jgi:hypothetical protein
MVTYTNNYKFEDHDFLNEMWQFAYEMNYSLIGMRRAYLKAITETVKIDPKDQVKMKNAHATKLLNSVSDIPIMVMNDVEEVVEDNSVSTTKELLDLPWQKFYDKIEELGLIRFGYINDNYELIKYGDLQKIDDSITINSKRGNQEICEHDEIAQLNMIEGIHSIDSIATISEIRIAAKCGYALAKLIREKFLAESVDRFKFVRRALDEYLNIPSLNENVQSSYFNAIDTTFSIKDLIIKFNLSEKQIGLVNYLLSFSAISFMNLVNINKIKENKTLSINNKYTDEGLGNEMDIIHINSSIGKPRLFTIISNGDIDNTNIQDVICLYDKVMKYLVELLYRHDTDIISLLTLVEELKDIKDEYSIKSNG